MKQTNIRRHNPRDTQKSAKQSNKQYITQLALAQWEGQAPLGQETEWREAYAAVAVLCASHARGQSAGRVPAGQALGASLHWVGDRGIVLGEVPCDHQTPQLAALGC